ncbi:MULTISPECIES: DUF397 domain-containing protein [unclassified Streptomyces]|uniref:DUF397 domain-containing protein n=1 Tax=unclassified Streptomyces TaxID=2593676 RepID=UPI00035F84E5|nr:MULTISPECIES: DUF397 domain-containing protein [unclassified Streptomyces]MYY04847.1 DUF397 domain-containing protein [Streptomyces sp. SID4913]
MTVFQFTKSSYSTPERECVEVARNVPGSVAIRDSKQAAGPVIVLAPAAWDAFQSVLAGRTVQG